MDILREKIIRAIHDAGSYNDENDFYTDATLAADAILAIPELKEALERRRQDELLRQMVALDEALGLYDDDEKVPRN